MEARARALLKRLAAGDAKLRRELSLVKLRLDGVRLGNVAYQRNGPLGVLSHAAVSLATAACPASCHAVADVEHKVGAWQRLIYDQNSLLRG